MHRRAVIAAVAVAVLGTAGGIAYADSSGGGTIKACAKTNSGDLRLDTGGGCLPSEQAVQWNQVGPQGPPGFTHTDERYYSSFSNGSPGLPVTVGTSISTATPVVTSHLSAGNYVVQAQVTAANHDGVGFFSCLLLNQSQTLGFAQAAVGNTAAFAKVQTITMTGAISLAQDADVNLSCLSVPEGDSPTGSPLVVVADIVTTKVDTATITEETH
jgi:hypothetical protein